ncbi:MULTISPECIES: Panacea domain-containing protein [unclassified Sphingobium]|uniref:Panacea domain-containing protein n=1 Tax=unclassified Sphingobium TaxID=2611147 RepID=UPI0035A6D20E
MTYTPQHIANYFLAKAEEDGRPLTPLKLIKLVYIAYGWVLGLLGTRLFEERIEAWKHGPVIPSIYHEFKHFGGGAITDDAVWYDLDTGDCRRPTIDSSDRDLQIILDKVWAAYKRFSGWALRQKTHEVGTPWEQTYDPNVKGKQIPDDLIKPHFQQKIREIVDAAER